MTRAPEPGQSAWEAQQVSQESPPGLVVSLPLPGLQPV